jgi:hypothetical protein
MTPASALARDLASLQAEMRAHREDIVFLAAARQANPQAADRAIEVRKARILACQEEIEKIRSEALRLSCES